MAGKSSAQRTFELLWGLREQPTRGPKPSLSIEQIVQAAIEIADSDGLEAVSMRRVAERFGVTTMSLYRYVPSKNDLLELMLEAIAAPGPDPAEMPGHWRDALHWWARQNLSAFRRHPWLVRFPFSHPPFGPNNIKWMESALRAMEGSGMGPEQRIWVLILLSGYVRSQAAQELAFQEGARMTGVEPEEWNRVYAGMLRKVVEGGEHPALAKIVESGVFDVPVQGPDEDFEYGLMFLLDGIEAMINSWLSTGQKSSSRSDP
jgi:AcrR family transcriptional regulator